MDGLGGCDRIGSRRRGPAGLAVEWDAEIINEVENTARGWRSLAGSVVVSAGSVNFGAARGGRSTQVSVHLQHAPPAGRLAHTEGGVRSVALAGAIQDIGPAVRNATV